MVLWYKNTHVFERDFQTVSLAFFNRYPNPYAAHVLSIDTIARDVDADGRLHTTRLIKKMGKLPAWARPLLGRISESWIIEMSSVDAARQEMRTYTRNLDHTKVIKVEEYTCYRFRDGATVADSRVRFSSGIRMGIKGRIESWSHRTFDENIKRSRLGMAFVMDKLEERAKLLL
ncbi:AAR075Cp [Eremothecium gossypii ATCC 10895]|uniref:AAR075Cp n=1 Tax=Eremothecium gossypii (strain ATCC 10895 / CBS 109.51 / FGSC 9923 / NRRL Y-1056) TaxID=284811 RepID=Q75EK4_EREGS|nr:AAR075Cp [Eremothecium gossypii ATCC 10895]AAS50440.1 AAR075Cp [Eremothecium gossypii ATCC 10895]AEY94726.1 FAAR075Cp [Eremothecium gossypii FDAG1]